MDIVDHYSPQSPWRATGPWRAIAGADEDGSAHALHPDIRNNDSLHLPAVNDFQSNSGNDALAKIDLFIVENAIGESYVLKATVASRAELQSIAGDCEYAVYNDDILGNYRSRSVSTFAF
jgi:hypothetical protein